MKNGFAKRAVCSIAVGFVVFSFAAGAQSPLPTFAKAFSPSSIGPGSVSTLIFTITNPSSVGARNLAFDDTLPAGVVIATPSVVTSTCAGSISAPAGGTTITFSDGSIQASRTCRVRVNVTSSTPGVHTNVSGDLTSDAGNSGSATADLTVATDRPGFSKAFAASPIVFGSRTTLVFTIDNSANGALAVNLTFSDTFPTGLVVASPANASTTCGGGTISAPAGGNTVGYSPLFFGDATVAANATCTVSVDVKASGGGPIDNVSGELTSTNQFSGTLRSSGKATARLDVTVDQLTIVKEFLNDPVPPGGTVTLQFTITNRSRSGAATAISFTDDLGATLTGLTATGLPQSDVCGSGSSLSGTSVISLTGGSVGPESSCTFSVTLQVPSGAADGAYTNTTSDLTGDSDGRPVTGSPATDQLFVSSAPLLTKAFVEDTVGTGSTTTIEFTITNPSLTETATDITFSDTFDVIFPTASATPGNDLCGTGSTSTFTPLIPVTSGSAIPASFSIAGGTLAPGASCTFSLTLDVIVSAATGTYTNTTSQVTATVGGVTKTGNSASDSVDVVAAPALIKEFVESPVSPGDTVTLRFTLELDADSPSDATGITFTDDLTAALSGLTAVGLPTADVCGIGSEISGTTNLTLSNATLMPGESCTFDVSVQVPASAPSGAHTNTTSTVMATVSAVTAMSPAASDDLVVAGLELTKEFTDDPVLPGGTVTLQFTIENLSSTSTATDIVFSDDLSVVIPGLVATGLPLNDICGTGSSLFGTSSLSFAGGSLGPGASCTFSATLQVPSNAEEDSYPNRTSGFRATIEGQTVVLDNATDNLVVASGFLTLMKEFIDDPVLPGDMVTLRFTLANAAEVAITDVAFTDDLDAALSGLVAVGLPVAACGGTASGSSVISFSGGSLASGEVCSFDVTLTVPSNAPVGLDPTNTTSQVTGTVGVLGVTGDQATDVLEITFVEFRKSFSSASVVQGDTVDLTFTIDNLSANSSLDDLDFLDDLDAMATGVTAVGLPANDVCGPGSILSGTSVIALSGGNLLPGGSCTFTVTVQVPIDTVAGDYVNETTSLRQSGGAIAAPPAMAPLTVEELVIVDSDGDGVLDDVDVCPNTAIPEGVPTVRLGTNRWALVDDDGIFDTKLPNGEGPGLSFTIDDTAGCSCEQIIEAQGLGKGHEKFGCSISAMQDWIALVNP